MSGLAIFYSISGALITVLLIRIYFKNRAANQNSQPVAPAAPKKPAARTVETPVSQPVAAEPVAAAPEPVITKPAVTAPVETAPAYVVPEIPAGRATTPSPYIASASSSIMRSAEVSTWEDRQLLENQRVFARDKALPPRVLASEVPGVDDSDRTFGSALNPALAAMLPDSDERRETARRELMAAGYYSPHALENLAATRYALMMLSIVVCGGLLLIVPTRLEPWAIAGVIAGPIMGWALPMLHVRRKAADRTREISRAMPDLLDMMNMCVSQGLTVPDSLKRILRDFRGIYPALSQELSIVTEQAQINDMRSALESFSNRIDLPEVHSFTSLLVQTERMGTSISDALTTYSDTMRESLKQRADEKGNRATFRLLFPTVLCLMPAVYLFLLGPAVNELSKFFNAGGRDSLDAGTMAVQRLNAQRNAGTGRARP